MNKPQKRASILVTRWFAGGEGMSSVNGEHTQRVSLPLSQIKLVEPYTQDVWVEVGRQSRPGAVRARINLRTEGEWIYVTETVEEVDVLMNEPWGEG